MSKGSEYIAHVLEQLMSDECAAQTCYQGAFLTAALSIIHEVESPLKERALVSLAAIAIRQRATDPTRRPRAA
jgi:hypothetical protein